MHHLQRLPEEQQAQLQKWQRHAENLQEAAGAARRAGEAIEAQMKAEEEEAEAAMKEDRD